MLVNKLYFYLFSMLERCIGKQKNVIQHIQHPLPQKRYLWVYVTSIGELHATELFIKEALDLLDPIELVILTDHIHYKPAFLRLFPSAIIVDHGETGDIKGSIQNYPPKVFAIAETPCFLHNAPCRFSYKVLHYASALGAKIIVINGWLYNEKPSCRMDKIEYFLLNKYYLKKIHHFLVQNDDIKHHLMTLGTDSAKISVTGNMKYDYLQLDSKSTPARLSLSDIIPAVLKPESKIITAGCLTQDNDINIFCSSVATLLKSHQNLKVIVAPRYPDKKENIDKITQSLSTLNIPFIFRSELKLNPEKKHNVILLDSIGELKFLYSISNACYVGVNHNVLEPLIYNKPVFVSSGWESNYPSFDVYKSLKSLGVITEITSSIELLSALSQILDDESSSHSTSTQNISALTKLKGATQASLSILKSLTNID